MNKITHVKVLLISTLLVITSSSVFAQVKIGTNPTTIEAASNLEVQASTANRQFKVDKTSGQVTIKDGTQAADRILTSDANGGASWKPLVIDAPNIAALPKAKLRNGVTVVMADNARYTVGYQDGSQGVEYLRGGFEKVGNSVRVPVTGIYMVTQKIFFLNEGCTTVSDMSAQLYTVVNGEDRALFDDRVSTRTNDRFTIETTSLLNINAGLLVASQCSVNYVASAGCTTRVIDSELSVTLLP